MKDLNPCHQILIERRRSVGAKEGPTLRAVPPELLALQGCAATLGFLVETGLHDISPSWPQTTILLISTSREDAITGACHHACPTSRFLKSIFLVELKVVTLPGMIFKNLEEILKKKYF
jgi:hypothetical protein